MSQEDLYKRLPPSVALQLKLHDALYEVLRQTKAYPVYAPLNSTEITGSPASDILWQQSAAEALQEHIESSGATILPTEIRLPQPHRPVFVPGMTAVTQNQSNREVSIKPNSRASFTEVH